MAWLWDSWEEYEAGVQPVMLDSPGLMRMAHRDSLFETECRLWQAAEKLEQASHGLHNLGFTGKGHDCPPKDRQVLDQAYRLAEDAVRSGEELLLYNKRLATSDSSYGFLHQKEVLDHWNRYEASGRIFSEIHQLMKDVGDLLAGHYEFVQAQDRFILRGLDLPSSLESDFRLARNLFSVGFDEVGLLIAGRGLEGVLRKVADRRKILLEVKGKLSPASETDVFDLIETMFQVRWKSTGIRVVSAETRALLHYLRTVRNSGAHSGRGTRSPTVNPRETAIVVAETANRLWNQVAGSKARLAPTTVQKAW